MAGQPTAGQRIAGLISARSKYLCDSRIVISGLGGMCMSTCMFVNARTTQETNLVLANLKKKKHNLIQKAMSIFYVHHLSTRCNSNHTQSHSGVRNNITPFRLIADAIGD